MNIKARWKKEKAVWPFIMQGYSRNMAVTWIGRMQYDLRKYEKTYGKKKILAWHKEGYLASSAKRYGQAKMSEYITDFDYTYLQPFNSSFSKWIDDILTTSRVLKNVGEHLRGLHYSVIQREGKQLVLKIPQDENKYTVNDIFRTVKEYGPLELRPSYWESVRSTYLLEYKEDILYVNGRPTGEESFRRTIDALRANYVLAEPVCMEYPYFGDGAYDHTLKFWMANDNGPAPKILCASISLFWNAPGSTKQRSETKKVDIETGTFVFGEKRLTIDDWDKIREQLCAVSEELRGISYYAVTIALQKDEPFQIVRFSAKPSLPDFAFGAELNDYLKNKAALAQASRKITFAKRWKTFKEKLFAKVVKKFCRPGIRPYMQQLWFESIKSDFLHTKDVSLGKKIWAWKRGFLSYRHYQYGLTPENYTYFLSDYDYHYVNRINNDYQKWINDKTTTRYILDPFKEHVPGYYFSCFNRNGEPEVAKMWDCPEHIECSYEGMLALLRERKLLALKPSAGTHGDGFYCLSYEDDTYFVNGQAYQAEQLIDLIKNFTSFYLLTEYVQMHSELKKIYAKSVNTVRVMVVNREGYNPKIMQAYMRVGSSSTGYTDNVGYGGICVMVRKETGELYQPETIKDHKFYDCPNHPDTGTPIAGFLPNWDYVCKRVLEISRYLGELEYLGFDIAITEDGFNLLEINIHQDLHKVATFDQEMLDYFHHKVSYKKNRYAKR